tara:strand:+ start:711 stop:1241 length:531 start_codon:yes stop_codon:yes gene_type:complete
MQKITLLVLITWSQLAFSNLLDVEFRKLASAETVNLADQYGGLVILVVNTASRCGYTPQFSGLDDLYEDYEKAGFTILGFPSNDFAGQDPGPEVEIANVCYVDYGVNFPMFEKSHVRGEKANKLYRELTREMGASPGWNFHKYLIGRNGEVLDQFPSHVAPNSPILLRAIKKALSD